jgi:hypothetical protein
MQEISVFALVFVLLAIAGGFGEGDNPVVYSGKLGPATYMQAQ